VWRTQGNVQAGDKKEYKKSDLFIEVAEKEASVPSARKELAG
jgi:hypothetical protein